MVMTRTLWLPLLLVNAIPTWHSFDLSPSSHQVNSQHPHSFPIWRYSTFSLSCVKSIPDVSSVLRLQSGEAWSRTSLAQCVLVCLSLPFIYLFPSCPLYVPLSHYSLPSARFSMSPQFPVSIYPHFIYLYSIFLSTLPCYSILTLQLIPDHSDYPNPYHTPHLYKYCSTSCCSSVW